MQQLLCKSSCEIRMVDSAGTRRIRSWRGGGTPIAATTAFSWCTSTCTSVALHVLIHAVLLIISSCTSSFSSACSHVDRRPSTGTNLGAAVLQQQQLVVVSITGFVYMDGLVDHVHVYMSAAINFLRSLSCCVLIYEALQVELFRNLCFYN